MPSRVPVSCTAPTVWSSDPPAWCTGPPNAHLPHGSADARNGESGSQSLDRDRERRRRQLGVAQPSHETEQIVLRRLRLRHLTHDSPRAQYENPL